MKYIPPSCIPTDEVNAFIKYSVFNDDIMQKIHEYIGNHITPIDLLIASDIFYLKLGIEHCNIRGWMCKCAFIMSLNFGKTNKLASLLFSLENMYTTLSSKLDDIVCTHYPLTQTYIRIPESITLQYEFHTNDKPGQRNITGIFYRSHTHDNYPVRKKTPQGHKKYSYYLSPDDIHFIIECVKRHNIYLNYVYSIIDNINSYGYKSQVKKEIEKMRKKSSRLDELTEKYVVNHGRVLT